MSFQMDGEFKIGVIREIHYLSDHRTDCHIPEYLLHVKSCLNVTKC